MYKIQLEVPKKDADPEVVEALKSVGDALGVEVKEVATASPDSYSLTIHTFPDEKE